MACTFCGAFNKAGCPTPNYCGHDFSREYHTQSTWTRPTSPPPIKTGPSQDEIKRQQQEAARIQQEYREIQKRREQHEIGRMIYDYDTEYSEIPDAVKSSSRDTAQNKIFKMIRTYQQNYGTAPDLTPIAPPRPKTQAEKEAEAKFIAGCAVIGLAAGAAFFVYQAILWGKEAITDLSFGSRSHFDDTLRSMGINRKYNIGLVLNHDDRKQNPYIEKVYSNSTAEEVGLEEGYKIISINGVNFRNMDKKYTAAKINSSFNEAGEVNITISIPNTGRWFAPDHRRNFYLEKPNKVEYKHSYQLQ